MKKTFSILVLLLGVSLSVFGQRNGPLERKSLRGLPGVYVNVGSLAPDIEAEGLTKERLQTDIEIRLRKAGIRVFSLEEARALPSTPTLNVEVPSQQLAALTKALGGTLFSISVLVELHQAASLERFPNTKFLVITWSDRAVGFATGKNIRALRDQVGDYIDKFINDFLSVNPK
jgi:hypothetical protein